MMDEQKIYVEKRHYDNLFKKYDNAMQAMKELKMFTESPSIVIFREMLDLDLTLKEQQAYLHGMYNALNHVSNILEMEEDRHGKIP